MSSTGEERHPSGAGGETPAHGDRTADHRVNVACPYLRAGAGGWRGAHASREHHCGATDPAASIVTAKQRELCLLAEHRRCVTFQAAEATHPGHGDGLFWPGSRGMLIALEPVRASSVALPGPHGRVGAQAMLVGLMVLAFLVLVIARTSPPSVTGGLPGSDPGGVAGSASLDPGASASAVVDPTGSPSDARPSIGPTEPAVTPAPSPLQSPSTAASAVPSPSPVASVAVRYKVKQGDTLSSIAARFGTTVKKLKALNGIQDASLIHVGQVISIP